MSPCPTSRRALAVTPLVAVLSACHLGGGPVVAVGRGGRLSLGGQLGGGVGAVRSDLAADVYDSQGRPGGSLSLGAWTFDRDLGERRFGALAAIGASDTDEGTGFFAAAAPFLQFVSDHADPCDAAFTMATIAVGIRLRGDRVEVFLAPHVHRVFRGCGPST